MRHFLLLVLIPCASILSSLNAADYVGWRNDGSGAAADAGIELIDDISKAKVLWQSEDWLPTVYCHRGHGGDGPQGGYTNVTLADGLIYMQYYLPSGDFVEELTQKMSKMKDDKIWLVDADDVVVCIDAKTGKTRWRQVMAGKGANLWVLGALMHSQPVVADGKVYAIGTLGRVYCFDAKTGEPVWESSTGPGHERVVQKIADWKTSKDIWDPQAKYRSHKGLKNNLIGGKNGSAYMVSSPCVAGPVVAMADGAGRLVALDRATGEPRWSLDKAQKHTQSPLAWQPGERALILSSLPSGATVRCVDAATGKEVWTVDGAWNTTWSGPSIAKHKDQWYMVLPGLKQMGGRPSEGISCFTIDEQGAKKIWSKKEQTYFVTGYCMPTIYRGHIYMWHNEREGSVYHCLELEDGSVLGSAALGHGGMWDSLIAGDGRIFHTWRILDADPANFRLLCAAGTIDKRKGYPKQVPALIDTKAKKIRYPDGSSTPSELPGRGWCTTNAYADGIYYYRGYHHLYAVDMRK